MPRAVSLPSLLLLSCLLPALCAIAGCDMLRSDSANALHANRAAREEALRGNRLASSQALPAAPVSGDALVKLLAGKTHVHEYVQQIGAKPYLIVYEFYRADGGYLVLDTSYRLDAAKEPLGKWRVDGEGLCVSAPGDSEDHCYTIRLQANGEIQYWIRKPGDEFDGLITSQVSIVREGLQTPAAIPFQSR